ncbi:MAG: CheW protein [Schlesneria sp.]|nr:CheW protein [Schlesneria sp.]
MSVRQQLCTFFLDDLYFGVEVQKVQEVLRYQEMTRVPLAPPVVRGLINLRGQIVTAIDMRRRLGLPALSADRLPMNVVIRTDDGPVSLLVDEIGDVLEVDEETYDALPETLRGPLRDLIKGAYQLNGRLLLTLDSDRAVNVTAS